MLTWVREEGAEGARSLVLQGSERVEGKAGVTRNKPLYKGIRQF